MYVFRHQNFGQQKLVCLKRVYRVVPKNVHTPLPPPSPTWRAPPGSSVIFQLGCVPPGKNIYVKNAVALYFYAKDNCFCDKERIFFIIFLKQF